MSVDKTAIEAISRLVLAGVEPKEFDGAHYAPVGWRRVETPGSQPDPLTITTLTGLVEYLEANPDNLPHDKTLVIVTDPNLVHLKTVLSETYRQREHIMTCVATDVAEGVLGKFMLADEFNIALQSLFGEGGDRAKVLKVVGTLSEENVQTLDDDGVTQTVSAKAGIITKAQVEVPNPVVLEPYRTFMEIAQPPTPFVLRLKSKSGSHPLCALFEADGGQWKLESIKRISEFLRSSLPDWVKVIA